MQITIRDAQGSLVDVPPEAMEALKAATSFRPEGYQYDWQFKRGKWDGWVRLVKNSKFPTGLLPRITKLFDDLNIEYEVVREPTELTAADIDLATVDIESRPYQDDAVEAALLNTRGIIRAPTGAGKTAIGARIIVARGKHALVVVPTIDLLYQYKSFLRAHLHEISGRKWRTARIGQLGDGVVDPQPVTVATVRTAAAVCQVQFQSYEFGEYDDKDPTKVDPRKLREWVDQIGTLIVDEAHILGAQTVYDLATKLKCPNKYGMSASPWRDDGADLMIEAATGEQIYHIETAVLVDDGFLVPPIIRVVDTRTWFNPAAWGKLCKACGSQLPDRAQKCGRCRGTDLKSQFPECYRTEIVERPERNDQIARLVEEIDGPTLVLVKQVKHGLILEGLIPYSKFLSGSNTSQQREQTLQRVRDGGLSVLIATTIADLGLDLPNLRALVLAGGGKSSTRHLQRIGRAVRPWPGKHSALVVDLDDGHVHRWFRNHAAKRRRIEHAEWGEKAIWI